MSILQRDKCRFGSNIFIDRQSLIVEAYPCETDTPTELLSGLHM